MKTDSLFYSVFKNILQLDLDFLDLPYAGDNYNFVSEEIKQTGFRIDGLFKANEKNSNYRMSLRSANGLSCQEAHNLTAWGSDPLYPHLAAECQTQSETLVHERDHQATHAQQLQSQVDALSQTNTLLNQEKSSFAEQQEPLKNELAALKQSVDQQALSLSQSHTECEQLHNQLQQQEAIMTNLKAHYSESDARQRLLNDEMIKAEAQLELIKDVLLREPGL